MLKNLNIQNLAIAENITVDFLKGLNVITGETGSGKSLLVDALSLLRGCRVDINIIRHGFDSAQVTGIFSPTIQHEEVFLLLEKYGIPQYSEDPTEIILKRFIHRSGKHKASINENIVSLKILQLIAGELIDISSQFENQKLLDNEMHTYFLDEFCGNSKLYKKYLNEYNITHENIKKLKKMLQELELLKRERSLYEFELSQIQESGYSIDEFKKIEEIISKGNNSILLKKLCFEITENIYTNEINCINLFKKCKKNINKLSKISENKYFINLEEKLDEIILLTEDFAYNIELNSQNFDINEQEFDKANSRIEIYNKLLLKFGPKIEDIEEYRKKCEDFINKLYKQEQEIKEFSASCELKMKNCVTLAKQLKVTREKKLSLISESIEKELIELGMKKSKFVCILKSSKNNFDFFKHDELIKNNLLSNIANEFFALNKFGSERAQFLFTTNLGIDPQEIEKIASGGELSRIMLAIKGILFAEEAVSVFVFDEIDSGISGNIATKVGKKLSEFCKKDGRQAICITHLPQVACFAENHYIVYKEFKENKTITKIAKANEQEKLNEIALLLSGEAMSKESLAQAKVLIQEAHKSCS